MLTAVSDSLWGYNYVLCNEANDCLGRLKISWRSESGTVTLADASLEISREGLLGPWLVQDGGKVIASIIKPSAFSRAFRFIADGREYSTTALGGVDGGLCAFSGGVGRLVTPLIVLALLSQFAP